MAAYAALVSLMNTMDQIQNHPRLSASLDKNQIESLGQKISVLLDFMENHNSHEGMSKEAADLESQIASAAYAAEDVLELHVVDQILAGSSEKSFVSLLDLEKVIEDLDSVVVMVIKVKEEWIKEQQLIYSYPTNPSIPLTSGKTTMVGFDDYLLQLLDVLTRSHPDRQIIPIVGMGGIGKTTLARNALENSIIMHHFDVRVWITVSQDNYARQILLGILVCLGEPTEELDRATQHELGEQVYKILFRKRYLIVLDDMWSIEIWDEVRCFVPDNYNGSRIIVTTRLSDLANYLGSSVFMMKFLSEDESWSLFCDKVFGEQGCPPHLDKIGKTIVRKCRGLPLSIVVIAGLLRKSSMTLENWEKTAKDISSIQYSKDDQWQHILSLSYCNLPAHLKPCFLYIGVFPEGHEIRVSQIIKLWVAEGFLKPDSHKSLEDVAEDYLKDLHDRSFISVCSFRSNGKLKTFEVHDLLRDLCMRVVKKEKFLDVTGMLDTPQDKNWKRRIIIQGGTAENPHLSHTLESKPLARTLICDSPAVLLFKSRLLRVLIEVYSDSLDTTFQQVNLRFLACNSICAPIGWIHTYELPSSISLLWNVQTLIIDKSIDKVVAPSEIWEMPQLRHLKFHRISLPDPLPKDDHDDFVLQNLQTLRTVLDFRCSEEVCRRMPNIKKLRIFFDDFSGEGETSWQYGLDNVGNFVRLESLYCCFYTVPERNDLLQNLKFPCSLKKLILQDCELHWSDLTIIGLLPHLEVLKLKSESVRGPEWNPVEGEFERLKFLEIDSCYLIYWNADCFSFPCLEKLVLSRLYRLHEIPSSIGEIPPLQYICVVDCSTSAAISAVNILEEREEWGDDFIQVRVRFSEKIRLKEFTERRVGFRSKNLHIDGV